MDAPKIGVAESELIAKTIYTLVSAIVYPEWTCFDIGLV